MKSFFKLASISLQSQMYYRMGFFWSLFAPLFLLGGQFFLWAALYGNNPGGVFSGYTRDTMFTYTLFAFCINNLLTWSTENNLSREIRSGTVVSRCVRPMSFLGQSLAAMFGSIIPQGIVNFSIGIVILSVFRGHFSPPVFRNIPLFICSLFLAVTLRMLLIHVFSLLCFYTTSHLGLAWTRTALVEFFSGAVIPIAVFPGWLKTVSYRLPFPFMLQIPLSIFLGQQMPILQTFSMQIFWICIFLLADRVLYGHIRKNMVIAGG